MDENLCDCAEILAALTEAGFAFKRHLEFFPRGTLDQDWLPLPGKNGWPVLTKDKALRFTPLEKAKILEHALRIFAFSSGNLNGKDMANLLKANLRKLDSLVKKEPAPFVASITKNGLHLRKL